MEGTAPDTGLFIVGLVLTIILVLFVAFDKRKKSE